MTPGSLLFFFAGAALGLSAFAFFTFNKDFRLKARLWPLAHAAGLLLFIGWQIYREPGVVAGVGWGVLAAFLAWVNLRSSFFCPRCATLIYSGGPFEVREKCPACGYRFIAPASSQTADASGRHSQQVE